MIGMAPKKAQEREKGTGRYTYDGDWDRLCVCGHTLGTHTAVRARNPETGKMEQPCIVGDLGHEFCDCSCFRPKREKKGS